MASGGHSSSPCAGLSLSRPLLLQSTGSRRAGSAAVAHGPSCSEACGIFPDQGSNPCPLHWQADSQPLHHQGSPLTLGFSKYFSGSLFLSYLKIFFFFLPKDFLLGLAVKYYQMSFQHLLIGSCELFSFNLLKH